MKYRVAWHSTRTGRDYAAKALYADRATAQANADFCEARYVDLGLTYGVEAVDDAPEPEPETAVNE